MGNKISPHEQIESPKGGYICFFACLNDKQTLFKLLR